MRLPLLHAGRTRSLVMLTAATLAAFCLNVAAWPMTVVFDRYHRARKELPKLAANPRAFGQATICHAVFGFVLGLLEDALNGRSAELTS